MNAAGLRKWFRKAASAPVFSAPTMTRVTTVAASTADPPPTIPKHEQATSGEQPSTDRREEVAPPGATAQSPEGGPRGAPTSPGAGTTQTVEQTTATYGFPRYLLWVAIGFWLLASVAGAVSVALPTLPHESAVSRHGERVDTCFAIAPEMVADNPSIGNHWCTASSVSLLSFVMDRLRLVLAGFSSPILLPDEDLCFLCPDRRNMLWP